MNTAQWFTLILVHVWVSMVSSRFTVCRRNLDDVTRKTPYFYEVSSRMTSPMETFCTLLAICAGNSPVPGEFPTQKPVTRSFVVFFDLCRNKGLSKQSGGWWFETLSRPLWRHCNVIASVDLDTEGAVASVAMQLTSFAEYFGPGTTLHHCGQETPPRQRSGQHWLR